MRLSGISPTSGLRRLLPDIRKLPRDLSAASVNRARGRGTLVKPVPGAGSASTNAPPPSDTPRIHPGRIGAPACLSSLADRRQDQNKRRRRPRAPPASPGRFLIAEPRHAIGRRRQRARDRSFRLRTRLSSRSCAIRDGGPRPRSGAPPPSASTQDITVLLAGAKSADCRPVDQKDWPSLFSQHGHT